MIRSIIDHTYSTYDWGCMYFPCTCEELNSSETLLVPWMAGVWLTMVFGCRDYPVTAAIMKSVDSIKQSWRWESATLTAVVLLVQPQWSGESLIMKLRHARPGSQNYPERRTSYIRRIASSPPCPDPNSRFLGVLHSPGACHTTSNASLHDPRKRLLHPQPQTRSLVKPPYLPLHPHFPSLSSVLSTASFIPFTPSSLWMKNFVDFCFLSKFATSSAGPHAVDDSHHVPGLPPGS